MADAERRRAWRAWQRTGAKADEARLLQQRWRQGALSSAQLEFGAYAEDPAALAVVREVAAPLRTYEERVLWLRGWVRWGPWALARGLMAALWEVPGDRGVHGLVRAWWEDPGQVGYADVVHATLSLSGRVLRHGRAVAWVRNAFDNSSGEARERLLGVCDEVARLWRAGEVGAVGERLWRWGVCVELRGEELGEGETLRARVVASATPEAQRSRWVELRGRLGGSVEVRLVGGERVVGQIEGVRLESCSLRTAGGLREFAVREVEGVADPGGR